MQTFSSDSPLSYVQTFLVIASESEEEFDFSPSDVVSGVKICNTLDIFEKISYYKSDPFAPLDLNLLTNSYKIACTNIQNFEEEENYASTVWVDHTFGSDMKFIGYDMILFVSDMILIGSIF